MRRHRMVPAGTGKGSDHKPVRASTDGKTAKLGYESNDPAPGSIIGPNSMGPGEHRWKLSKWQGSGKRG